MRNDAKPMGEKVRGIDRRSRRERGLKRGRPAPSRDTSPSKSFVTDRDPGDEESTPNEESPIRKKI